MTGHDTPEDQPMPEAGEAEDTSVAQSGYPPCTSTWCWMGWMEYCRENGCGIDRARGLLEHHMKELDELVAQRGTT